MISAEEAGGSMQVFKTELKAPSSSTVIPN